MVTKSVYIIIVVVILCLSAFGVMEYIKKREPMTQAKSFNIATNPVVHKNIQAVAPCPKRPEVVNNTEYHGLNPKSNSNLSLLSFINSYHKDTDYNDVDAADITARQYCSMVYGVNNEYFKDRWSSISECELLVKKECEDLFPSAPKKAIFVSM